MNLEIKRLRKGDEISFKAIDDFTGQEIVLEGVVSGKAKDSRYAKDSNFADDEYIVIVKRPSGNKTTHLVAIPDLLGGQA